MSTQEVAAKLVQMCREGKNTAFIEQYYADNVFALEAVAGPTGSREMSGKPAILGKNQWWMENHDVHSAEISDPMYNGDDRFACTMKYDVTFKPASKRMVIEEVAVYTVADGKIVREEFFYDMSKMQ